MFEIVFPRWDASEGWNLASGTRRGGLWRLVPQQENKIVKRSSSVLNQDEKMVR